MLDGVPGYPPIVGLCLTLVRVQCAPHTHQLALDMQLSLLVPPLVWLLVKAWPLASPVIVVLIGGSTWLRQQAALQHNVSLLIYNGAKYVVCAACIACSPCAGG